MIYTARNLLSSLSEKSLKLLPPFYFGWGTAPDPLAGFKEAYFERKGGEEGREEMVRERREKEDRGRTFERAFPQFQKCHYTTEARPRHSSQRVVYPPIVA